jgi:hypothetical protein
MGAVDHWGTARSTSSGVMERRGICEKIAPVWLANVCLGSVVLPLDRLTRHPASQPQMRFRHGVGNFADVKASRSIKTQRLSMSGSQQLQYQSDRNNRFHRVSKRAGIWFGTRGSEVQILSPRPISLTTNHPTILSSLLSIIPCRSEFNSVLFLLESTNAMLTRSRR